MIRLISLVTMLISLVSAVPALAGYTIHTAPQVAEWVTVNGVSGPAQWPGREPAPPAAMGREVCRPADYSQYAAEASRRTRVFEDAMGVAASSDLFAACPQVREQKAKEIRAEGARRLEALTPYSAAERDTWPQQQAEAREWRINSACDCAMIRRIAEGRGISVESLVGKIEENIALYPVAAGLILGQQQKLLDRIYAEQDFATMLAIGWPQ